MKTLLITLEYPPFKGGVANYYSNLVKYWPLSENIKVIDNSKTALLNKKDICPWFKSVNTIRREKKLTGFDHLLVGQILPLGTAAYIASFIIPIKYTVILHGMDFTLAISHWRKNILTSLILGRATKIVCANSRLADLVTKYNPALKNKTHIVNPGIEPIIAVPSEEDLKKFKIKNGLEGHFVLLTLGRLVLRKGVDTVIKALNLIDEGANIKYVIAGSGEEESYLKNLASQSKAKDSIVFVGEITEDEKWMYLHACDLFIMPTREINNDFEGFGIVYLEANMAQKIVIAGNSGGVRDAVEHGFNGYLINPENVEEIKNKIIELRYNPLLPEKGKSVKEKIVKKFNWENQSRQFCDIIKA